MKERLLIIENDPTVQLCLEQVLQDEFEVISKRNELEAIEWLEADNEADLLIANLHMPLWGFEEFIKTLRLSTIFRQLPVIMLVSEKHPIHERIKCLELGADDYIVKPFHPIEVKARVKNTLKRRPKSTEAMYFIGHREMY